MRKMINFFKKLFGPKRVKIKPIKEIVRPIKEDNPNKKILLKAISQIGVNEIAGKKSNKQIVEYHRYSTKDNDKGMDDSIPWCASFICWVLEVSGFRSTNSKMARSYERWGFDVSNRVLPGDIITFWRKSKSSGYGHVGIFLLTKNGYAYVLGGNQNDEVNVTRYKMDKVTCIRRCVEADLFYTKEEDDELKKIANDLVFGEDVGTEGRVT